MKARIQVTRGSKRRYISNDELSYDTYGDVLVMSFKEKG
jgi:hypothetical protein